MKFEDKLDILNSASSRTGKFCVLVDYHNELIHCDNEINMRRGIHGWYILGKDTGPLLNHMIRFNTYDDYLRAADKYHAIESSPTESEGVISDFEKLYNISVKLNDGWKPNWLDMNEPKWSIFLDDGEFYVNRLTTVQSLCGIYFKSGQAAKTAIKEFKK